MARRAPVATLIRTDATGGWDLLLVDRIARRWTVMPTPGTCVWFEIGEEGCEFRLVFDDGNFGADGRARRPALAIDIRGFGRPRYQFLAFPGEEPPSIECNEDAGQEFVDE